MRHRFLLAATSTCIALASLPARAQSIRTITDIWGGSNSGAPGCAATFGPTPELLGFFNGGGFRAVGGNTACGYSGSTTDQSAASGTLLTTRSLAATPLGSVTNPYGSFSGDVSARASYGSLGVASAGRLTGGAVNTDAVSAASAAFFDDMLTASSPLIASNSNGYVRYGFQIDGSLAVPATQEAYHPGYATVQLNYQHGSGSNFNTARLTTQTGATGQYYAQNGSAAGWTFGIGTLSGSGSFFSGLEPITFGVPWELQLGMLAQTIGEGAASFLSTARIASVEFYDAQGVRLEGVDLAGVSGTQYAGVAAPVPEPHEWMLMAGGLIGWMAWRKRRVGRIA